MDASRAENKQTGEVTRFVLRNRCWDIDVDVVPPNEVSAALEKRSKQVNALQLAPFSRQAPEERL